MNTNTVVIGLVLMVLGVVLFLIFICLGALLVLAGFIVMIIGLTQSEPKKVIIQTAPGVFVQVPEENVRAVRPGIQSVYGPAAAPEFCPSCNMPLRPIDMWCPHCGRQIVREPATVTSPSMDLPMDTIVICPQCGTRNVRTDSLCRNCETDLSETKRRLAEKIIAERKSPQ